MTSWHYPRDEVAIGVDWQMSSDATSVSVAPVVYRWDRWDTDNWGSKFWETLSPDTNGAGSWSGLGWPASNGANDSTRRADSFAKRIYKKGHSAYTVKLTIGWDSNFCTWVSGYGLVYTGAGSHAWSLDVPALAAYAVKYDANGGSGAPGAQTKWHGESLALSTAKPARTGYAFQGWATASNGAVKYAAGASYTGNAAVTLYAVWKINAPTAPAGCSVVRNSDNKNTVSWALGSNAGILYSGIYVERSVDGGAWSQIASVGKSATSYADASTAADHSYAYRVRSYNATGSSAYSTSGTVYNTPSAPGRPAVARSGETTVEISMANGARTATGMEVQRCTDTADSSTYVTLQALTGKVTSAADDPGGGTFYYRARNTRGSLLSAWSAWSGAVVTMCAPMAPTLSAPASSAVVSKAEEDVAFAWTHNPIDGSAQTAAQLRYSTDGGSTWAVAEVAAEQRLEVANGFEVNAEVTWGVRTRGAHADYGPWSANRTFLVRQVPSVSFAQPADGFVVENMPIRVEIAYGDPSGALADAVLSISHGGSTVYEREMGASAECDIAAADFLPADGESYTLAVAVRSSSTLSASATRDVQVSFIPPARGTLGIENDPETGHVSLLVGLEEHGEDEADAEGISVYRVADGARKLLGEGLSAGAAIVDRYAPLNVGYSYEVVTFAASGAVAVREFERMFKTGCKYFYFGDDIAKVLWNVEESKGFGRPSRNRVYYAGRKHPLSYDMDNVSDERTVSAVLMEREEAAAFKRMVESGGRCFYKNGDGEVFMADAEVSIDRSMVQVGYYGTVSVKLARIDGGEL